MTTANELHLPFTLLAFSLIFFSTEFTRADRSTYIVHMDKSTMPKAFASHNEWYSATVDSLSVTSMTKSGTLGPKPRLLYIYDNALHGFSAVLSLEEVQKLEKSVGFITAYQDKIYQLHTTHSSDFLSLNTVSGLWPASNYGKDVIIGLMDTGVWPESKSYNDDGMSEIPTRWKGICQEGDDFNSSMCNRKLIGARYYNDGAKAANLHSATDGGSPRDFNGHGTHTSTIAAGNYAEDVSFFGYAKGTARGMAPRAHVAMYQVSADVGTTSDFIAGMDQAIADGVDVISISQGLGQTPLHEDSMAIAGFSAVEKGVFVSVSAGNSGPDLGMVENGVPWLLTVGASSIDRQNSAILTFGNGNSIIGWSQFPANALLDNVFTVYNQTLLACNSSELLSELGGKIVICSDDYWYFVQQTQAVVNSNVAAAIFITNETKFMEKYTMDCPGVVITHVQASELISYVTSTSNPRLSIKFQQEVLGEKPAPAISFFSSRGPSQTYPTILKPDLIAPGSKVLAAFSPLGISAFIGSNIVLSTDYTLMSGTSMAAPHAAGVAALLKSAHPDWSPAAIRSAMMTTASQIGNDRHPIRDNGHHLRYATSLDMGAGHIDPKRALNPGLVYDADTQDYINHLCFMNFTRKQIITITRLSNYSCSSSDLNYPSFMAFWKSSHLTSYEFQRTLTNVGDDTATYKAKVRVPIGTSVIVTPSTLVFNEKNDKLCFNLTVDIKQMEKLTVHGYLVWEQVGGNHTVRSPIVVVRKL